MQVQEEREHVMSGNFDQLHLGREWTERDNEVQWRLFVYSGGPYQHWLVDC